MDRLLPEYLVVGLEANEGGAKGWKCLSSPACRDLKWYQSWHRLCVSLWVGKIPVLVQSNTSERAIYQNDIH